MRTDEFMITYVGVQVGTIVRSCTAPNRENDIYTKPCLCCSWYSFDSQTGFVLEDGALFFGKRRRADRVFWFTMTGRCYGCISGALN